MLIVVDKYLLYYTYIQQYKYQEIKCLLNMNTFRLYMTKQDHIATYVIMYYIINHQEILITYKEFEKLYIYIFYIIDICIIYNNI